MDGEAIFTKTTRWLCQLGKRFIFIDTDQIYGMTDLALKKNLQVKLQKHKQDYVKNQS